MSKTRRGYPPEFRRQMVELVHAGRTPEELVREFEPTAQPIHNWVSQSERKASRGNGRLTSTEREELTRRRRENRQPRLEREILSKAAAAWFARETNADMGWLPLSRLASTTAWALVVNPPRERPMHAATARPPAAADAVPPF